MIPLVFWLLAAGMLTAAVFSGVLRLWLLTVVVVALTWDNLIVAAGALIGAGDLLRALSVPRYVAHAVLTPLLIPIVFGIAQLRRRLWVWALTGGLIALGVYTEIIKLHLELREYAGTLRYAHAAAGPPIPAIATVLVLIGVGVLLWKREGVPWLCLGAVAMFASAGSGVFWLGNAGELILIVSILLTAVARIRLAKTPSLGSKSAFAR
ncbi:hypothetical protein [Caulobacter hibisci]|uniref:Uncharacterized protein n=1 Tax=Caulobacter hibisci TaxID=2035993 RepID=A0ABS0T428_9CAUL|nr:hypothetical protein [Caulobacter hibisci]MBI1685582.1 hypothetical protein [Caulobacter hibisci]